MVATVESTGVEAPLRKKPRIFYGWWIVITAVLLNIFQGGVIFYGFTHVIEPMTEETGWTLTQVTTVFPILGVFIAIIAPILGLSFDKIGPRPLLGGGMTLLGAGLIMLHWASSLPMFYLWFSLANIGSAAMWLSIGPAVANWFVRKRGRALGIYTLGYALAGILSQPFYLLIEWVGWRDAFLIVGVIFFILMPVAVIVIRHRPENMGLFPDGADEPPPQASGSEISSDGEMNVSAMQALRSQAFWLMAMASALAFLTIATLQVHWTPYLRSVGYTKETAALLLTFLPLSTVAGRLGFGFLADLWDKKSVTALAFATQAAAVLLLAFVDASHGWVIYVFLTMWGLGFGGTIVTRMALQGYLFGRNSFGALQGMLSMTSEAGFAFSPLLASLVFEEYGSYQPLFLVFAALVLLATPITLIIRRPRLTPRTVAPVSVAAGTGSAD